MVSNVQSQPRPNNINFIYCFLGNGQFSFSGYLWKLNHLHVYYFSSGMAIPYLFKNPKPPNLIKLQNSLIWRIVQIVEKCAEEHGPWHHTAYNWIFAFLYIFSKPCFSNTWTVNSLMFKLLLEKAEEPEIKLPTSAGSWKKQDSSRKTSISALLTMPKPLTVKRNCGKFSQETVENSERDGNTRPPDLPLEKYVCRSGSNS